MRRVVVTGMGMVTPLGGDLESTWSALLAGRSGVGPITLFDARTFPTRIAAEVHDFRLDDYIDDAGAVGRALPQQQVRHRRRRDGDEAFGAGETSRTSTGAGSASTSARAKGSRISPGSSTWSSETTRDGQGRHGRASPGMGLKELHPIREAEQEPGTPAGHLASLFGAEGPNANCLTACAASSQAIGEAVEIIRRGDADVMLSGGTHSMIHPFGVTGFNLLTALSTRNDEPTRASRPFDRDRDGFILGEGAGMLVLEELEHAKARGATIYGEIVGYGSTADAFRITDSHDEGRGAIACISEALADAGLDPEDVDYINAHGTSTSVNDSIETLAIKRTFGEHGLQGPDLEHQEHDGPPDRRGRQRRGDRLPAGDPRRRHAPDDQPGQPRPRLRPRLRPARGRASKAVDVALSNSFGFGGQNIALILRRFAD